MKTAEEIRHEVQRIKEISTLPQVMRRVMEIVLDERSSSKDLAREISHDQALTAKILKIVNSAFYGFYRQIASVEQAVVILGYKEIRSIAITVSVVDMIGSKHSRASFDRKKLWEHSIGVGMISDIIRENCCRFEEAAFVAGLLHDIGKVVLDEYFAPEYDPVVQRFQEEERSLVDIEQETLGITHAEVGYILAERWNLPKSISHAVLKHHQEPRSDSSTPLEGIVYLSNGLAKQKGIGLEGDSSQWVISDDVSQVIGLKEYHLEKINTSLMKQMATLNAMVGYLVNQA